MYEVSYKLARVLGIEAYILVYYGSDSHIVDALMSDENVQALISVQSMVIEIVALKDEIQERSIRIGPCVRCGVISSLQAVSLDGKLLCKSLLCHECIKTVIHANSAYKIHSS